MARQRKVKDAPAAETPPAEQLPIENAAPEAGTETGTQVAPEGGDPAGGVPKIVDNDPLGIGEIPPIANAEPQVSTATSIDTTEETPDDRAAWERYPMQTERRELRVELKMSERARMGIEAAQLRHDADEKAEAVKAAASAGKATVKAMQLRAEKLESAQLRGYDEVSQPCRWYMETSGVDKDTGKPIWHPEMKTLVRQDTGAAVEIVGMTRQDFEKKELLAAQDTYTPAEGEETEDAGNEQEATSTPMNDAADVLLQKVGYRNVLDSIGGTSMTPDERQRWIHGICDDNNFPRYDQPDISMDDLRAVVLACQTAAEEDGYEIEMSYMPEEPEPSNVVEGEFNEDPTLNLKHDTEDRESEVEDLEPA